MRLILYTLLLLFISNISYAQISVDPTFNPADVGYGDFSGVKGTVQTQTIQSDGKIVIGGTISGYNSYNASGGTTLNLMRINADGTRDASFNTSGSGPSGTVYAVAIQGDGKIIIGGSFSTYNGITVNGICRVTATGGFDPTFNPGLGVAGNGSIVYALSVLTDGKIMIGGAFTTYNSITVNGIARLTTNGALDNTFNVGGAGLNSIGNIRAFALQTDGKLLVGGSFNSYNGNVKNSLVRINNDGTNDNAFNASLGFTDAILLAIVLQQDGKIWVGGYHISNSPAYYTGILLLSSTGTVDPSFAPSSGIGSNGSINAILPVANNKLLVAGFFETFNTVARLSIALVNTNGTLDPSFNLGYTIAPIITAIYNIQQNTDGSLIFSGNFNNTITGGNNGIEKLTANYTIDPSFNAVSGAKGTIKAFETQADGKIIISGQFNTYNGISRNRIARLTADGAIDNTFNPGIGTNGDVNAIAIQNDGKIIAAGNFTSFNNTTVGKIVRTDATGNIDGIFVSNNGTGANDTINTIAVQADGKIIIGGKFTFFNGNTSNYLARLNANGSFDNTFNIGSGGFGQVRVIRIQTDGKILIGGDFQFFNSSTIGRIARLNPDGSIDNTFNPTSTGTNGSVYDIQVTGDGSIFVGGEFTTYNGLGGNARLIKLNNLGVRDNSFLLEGTLQVGYNVYSISAYENGKLLISAKYNSTYNIFKLTSTGALDNTSTGGGLNNSVSKLALVGNGSKILIAGSFTSFNSIGRNRIARLSDASILPLTLQSFTGNIQNNNALINWITSHEVNTKAFVIERSNNSLNFTDVGTVTATGNTTNAYQFTDFAIASFGGETLYYRLKMLDKDGSFSYSPIVAVKINNRVNISLSPNPTRDIVWVNIQATLPENISIHISDVLGKEVLLQNKTVGIGATSLSMNVSTLKAGIYYVKIVSSERNETLKLVKE
jgi:uncharacterized delta-60 repeat protein